MNAASPVLSRVHPVSERRHTAVAARPARRRILLVEDEAPIRELLRLHLSLANFDIDEVSDGTAALDRARTEKFDLIVLDVMVPGLDGITLCRAIRSQSVNMASAVLMLTARASEADKVLGLESGADDYLAKPFGVAELVARARALMRRPRASADPTLAGRPLTVRGLTVDPAKRRVTVGDRDVDLTSHEFELLFLLVSHPGVVYSREAVLARIWKGDTFVTERSVDALVKRLRRKVESDPGNPVYVLTVWGTGYKFADE
jgi:two-component system OmpR family response regulator/two-component system alkaline phosphatase synthesis response regulator PhoP